MNTPTTTFPAVSNAGFPGRRGFTLIELLVVISIIVILVAVSAPVLSKLSQSNKKTQAVNLATAYIANARALAIQYKRPAAVVFYEQSSYAGASRTANQTAVMLAVADIDQGQSAPGTIVFTPVVGQGPQYMPAGIKVATLDDDIIARTAQAGDAKRTRAIVFDASGQLVLRSGLAARWNSASPNGSPDHITFDWNFFLQNADGTIDVSNKVTAATSSPGVMIYDGREYNEATGSKTAWIETNADIIIVNAYTGNVLR